MQDDMTKKIKGTALILDLCCHVGNLEHLIQVSNAHYFHFHEIGSSPMSGACYAK